MVMLLHECAFDSPAVLVDTHLNCLPIDVKERSPIANGHGSSIQSKQAIPARVPGLLCNSLPLDVAWFVWSVVTYAGKRVFAAWNRSDISEKRLEGFAPAVTNFDFASAIARKPISRFISAARKHIAPRPVLFSPASPSVLPMLRSELSAYGAAHFCVKAAATVRLTSAKCLSANNLSVTALALAQPEGYLTVGESCRSWRSFPNGPSTYRCAGQVNELSHAVGVRGGLISGK